MQYSVVDPPFIPKIPKANKPKVETEGQAADFGDELEEDNNGGMGNEKKEELEDYKCLK